MFSRSRRNFIHLSPAWTRVLGLFLFLSWIESPAADLPVPPPGWRIELVAEAPRINHPSVVCSAPDGRVFVAEDPMDIRVDADAEQGRIICFHPDGSTSIFAEKLHAVFGMQYLEGKLYVLHNPRFTVFTDAGRTGRAPVDLIRQTNPKPWALDWNDHVPANFRLAMDGYFYVAVGDKGIYGAEGTDGKRVDLPGGGILRLRPEGTGLEAWSLGVRNILDVALDREDEIFTYDNTDEHDWMGRLTHMVDGGFYGYPHDFIPRRPYTLWMIYDFGAGAATGALVYNEDAWPETLRGNIFLADFGKRQVTRAALERQGATFALKNHEELFKERPDDFRPVGIAESADGASLYICDWQHRDTKEDVRAGRLWKLTFAQTNLAAPKPEWFLPLSLGRFGAGKSEELITGLSHPARSVRLAAQRELARRRALDPLLELLANTSASDTARIHALWALDAIDGGQTSRARLNALIASSPPALRRQAIRQSGTRRVQDDNLLPFLHTALQDNDASIRFQSATALGRIARSNSIPPLVARLAEPDFFARYAHFTAINRIGRRHPSTWNLVVKALRNENARIREGAFFALRETFDATLLESLTALLNDQSAGQNARLSALQLIADLHHQKPEWKGEWGAYHPALAPPPARTESWTGTPRVLQILAAAVDDPDPALRLAAVDGIRAGGYQTAAVRLRDRFSTETDLAVRRAILKTLAAFKDSDAVPLLVALLNAARDETLPDAIAAASRIGGSAVETALLKLFRSDATSPPVLSAILNALADLKSSAAAGAIAQRLAALRGETRLEAVRALGKIGGETASSTLRPLLNDPSVEIRREAILALGQIRDRAAIPLVLSAWQKTETRGEALQALTRMPDQQALEVYLDGLGSANPVFREQSRKALAAIRDSALATLEARVLTLKPAQVLELRRIYDDHSAAKRGPLFSAALKNEPPPQPGDYERYAREHRGNPTAGQRVFFDETGVACLKCHVVAGHGGNVGPDLTLAGAQFDRLALIESVLYPSKAVREGYQQTLIEKREGDAVAGIVKGETADALTLIDASAQTVRIAKSEIASRKLSSLSLMPEDLFAGLNLDQFADLIAFLESRKVDPRVEVSRSVPAGYERIFNGRTAEGWKEFPAGTKRIDASTTSQGRMPEHWRGIGGVLEHDGVAGDLWSEREFGNFELHLEWRWPDPPRWEEFPLINSKGLEGDAEGHAASLRVLDSGDSGVLLRGLYKAQANLFCYPVGSGEVWEYRTDPAMTPEQRRAVTPRLQADRPVGDWNEMVIRMREDQLTVVLNGEEVIANAQLPGVPARGPIGLQHEHGRIQFRNLWVKPLP